MRHPLPYAFARTAQLLLEDDGHQLVLLHRTPLPAQANALSALAEVQRRHGPLPLLALDNAALAQRITATQRRTAPHLLDHGRHGYSAPGH